MGVRLTARSTARRGCCCRRCFFRCKRTVLFVTHDLHEAIFLSDIVVVFTNRPGRVKSIIPVELKRPRPPPAELAIAPEFRDIYSRIWSDLKDEVREFE